LRDNLALAQAQSGFGATRDLRRAALEREQALYGAQARFGMSSAAAQSRLFLAGQGEVNAFQRQTAGSIGTNRGQALADFGSDV
jgi:hypothetical protein